MIFIQCDSNDASDSDKLSMFMQEVHGTYELRNAVVNIPIDLDGDSISQTNLYVEGSFCGNSKIFDSYKCSLTSNEYYNEFSVEVPLSEFSPQYMPDICLRDKHLLGKFIYNSDNDNIVLEVNDFYNNYNSSFRSVVLDTSWENRWVYFTIKTEFYDKNGHWKNVELFLSYEKILDTPI
ncbi:hypothetical protein F0365_00855 [Nonlabens sp. Ci31]|uniref:hypothetical protein n=1 Tax=Nonlabens sp. Ci31 TaxID=2608253 RepID=UPI001463981C|nr:hypothetical protein [Nonlabens sp. Ci31]QJP33064.1 hypothetical protein F0365_00855 [Nonlabens sp. Ci31]